MWCRICGGCIAYYRGFGSGAGYTLRSCGEDVGAPVLSNVNRRGGEEGAWTGGRRDE